MGEDDEALEECGQCARPLDDVDESWSVELAGPDGYVGWTLFCSQEHAARWVGAPARAEEQVAPEAVLTTRDRLLDAAVAAVFVVLAVWAVVLMALGSFQLVQLLGGWR